MFSLSTMKEVLGILLHIDVVRVVSVLGITAACLLMLGIILYILFGDTVNRKVERVRREVESKHAEERKETIQQQRQGVQKLLQVVSDLSLSMHNASVRVQEGAELVQQQCKKEGAYVSPISSEARQAFLIELLALEKALKHLDCMLQEGIVLGQLDFYLVWYNELRFRFEQALKQEALSPQALAPSIVEAIVCDATAVWCDTVRFTLETRKSTLLEYLQYSQVQTQIAFAQAARTLAHHGSDARWQASGEYRKALILWASCDAIRLVLKARRKGIIDLDDPQVLAPYFDAFLSALAQRCADDQQALLQGLHAEKRTTTGNGLLAVSQRFTVYHAVTPMALLYPSPAS
jgi:hypothetical protein